MKEKDSVRRLSDTRAEGGCLWSLGQQGWARGGEDACVGPGRRGLSCRFLPMVMPVVVTTSSRRRRVYRVFNSSTRARVFESCGPIL